MEVNCPTCKKTIEWSTDNPHRPFCSKKCQLIDLGEWTDEEGRTISTPIGQANNKMLDLEDIEAMLAEQQESFFKE